jgi:GNAT superfamily N-acetyltransferase
MAYTIRAATPADASTIAEFNDALAKESEGKTLDRARLLAGVQALLIDEHKGIYHLAIDQEGRAVGQVMFTFEWSDWRNGWIWWLQSVYVLPLHRGKGVFRNLFDHLVQVARKRSDVVGFRLYVEDNNLPAHAVYGKCGFQRAGYFVLERPLP